MTSSYGETRVSQAKLRAIARWLGWNNLTKCYNSGCSTVCTGWIGELPDGSGSMHIPNFYEDESANAEVLDRLLEIFPYVTICFQRHKGIEIEASGFGVNLNFDILIGTSDRKLAIIEAAMKLASELPKE